MRRLQQILTGETAFGDLLRRRSRELALETRVRAALPAALAGYVRVADARSVELALLAASGAAAALLRQRSPELLETLSREGWEFTGIRVRVQARPAAEIPQKSMPKQIDDASVRRLVTLAGEVGDTALAHALRRLARQGRASRSDSQEQALEGVEDEDGEQ